MNCDACGCHRNFHQETKHIYSVRYNTEYQRPPPFAIPVNNNITNSPSSVHHHHYRHHHHQFLRIHRQKTCIFPSIKACTNQLLTSMGKGDPELSFRSIKSKTCGHVPKEWDGRSQRMMKKWF